MILTEAKARERIRPAGTAKQNEGDEKRGELAGAQGGEQGGNSSLRHPAC